MFAAAAFRGVVYGQLLYAGDDVSAAEWDERSWDAQHSARDRRLDLAIDAVLTEAGVPHDRGLTWTTDAFFRETTAKVARRRDQGCITVEMEAASMFAAATFRGVVYGQLLYAGDDVSAAEWDERSWDAQHSARDRLLDLALDAVIRLSSS